MSIKSKKLLLYIGTVICRVGLGTALIGTILSLLVYYHVLNFVDPTPPAAPISSVPPAISATPLPLDATVLYADINAERVKVGLSALAISSVLEQSACLKADDMIARDYWSHDAPDGTQPWDFFRRVGYSYLRAGENLAFGQISEAGTVENWMNSPKHKDNILGNYTQMGLCSRLAPFYQGSTNQTLIVNHFGTPK